MTTIKVGNTVIKIYHWKGKSGYDQFKVAYRADGQRKRETFGSLSKAKARANEIAVQIERGERDMLKLSHADRATYLHALRLLEPLSIPLNVAVEEYVAARRVLGIAAIADEHPGQIGRHFAGDRLQLGGDFIVDGRKGAVQIGAFGAKGGHDGGWIEFFHVLFPS